MAEKKVAGRQPQHRLKILIFNIDQESADVTAALTHLPPLPPLPRYSNSGERQKVLENGSAKIVILTSRRVVWLSQGISSVEHAFINVSDALVCGFTSADGPVRRS